MRKTVNCNSVATNKARLRHDKYKFHSYTADFPEDFNAPNRSETSNVVNKPNVDKTNKKLWQCNIYFTRLYIFDTNMIRNSVGYI